MNNSNQKGFSLMELLVVIFIIGILATIIISGINQSRKNARDAHRYADLLSMTTALEGYANLHDGLYPSTSGAWWSVCSGGGSHATTGSNGFIPNVSPTYISVLPTEPLGCSAGLGSVKGYLYRSDGTNYKLLVDGTAEVGTECLPGKQYDDPIRAQQWCAFFTPGGANW